MFQVMKSLIMVLAVVGLVMMMPAVVQAKDEMAKSPAVAALPEKADAAVKAAFPKATLGEVRTFRHFGEPVYVVALKEDGKERIAWLRDDGTIIAESWPMALADLPKAVADEITRAAEGAKIDKVAKVEWRVEFKEEKEGGKPVPLAEPKITYHAHLMKGDQCGKVEVDANGKLVREVRWGKGEHGGGRCEMHKPAAEPAAPAK
ncbi:MAG: hypothetical protein NT049_07085 [Planctomycetota bacterium]|nr:hypothetical protein [Planctomycetota bacterium]